VIEKQHPKPTLATFLGSQHRIVANVSHSHDVPLPAARYCSSIEKGH
jgi:hypothetical protein